MTVHILERGSTGPSAALLDVGVRDSNGVQIGCMEMSERVKAVRAYSKTQLLLPELIRNLRREQFGDVTTLTDALDYKVREQDRSDTGGRFGSFDNPCSVLITDDGLRDVDKVSVDVGHGKGADFTTTEPAISGEQDGDFDVGVTEDVNQPTDLHVSWDVYLLGCDAVQFAGDALASDRMEEVGVIPLCLNGAERSGDGDNVGFRERRKSLAANLWSPLFNHANHTVITAHSGRREAFCAVCYIITHSLRKRRIFDSEAVRVGKF